MARVATFDIKCFNYAGVNTYARFLPHDVMECNDVTFVRMGTSNRTLITIAMENNTLVPEELDRKRFKLTQSCGFKGLKLKRDAARSGVAPKSSCSLFANSAAQNPTKKIRRSSTQQSSDSTPDIITIDIDGQSSVRVMSCKKGQDPLWVEYDSETLTTVMNIIRTGGFEKSTRDASGNVGIWMVGDGRYRATWKDEGGAYHSKKCNDLDEAIGVRALRLAGAEACDADVEACDADDDASGVAADANEALGAGESLGSSADRESVTDSTTQAGDMDADGDM
jgi:hypothetical protein